MAKNTFSDEPNLIQPKGPNYRLLGAIASSVLIVALVASIPLYQSWMHHQAHEAERGQYEGAIYDIEMQGQSHRVELAWAGSHLAVVVQPEIAHDAQIQLRGDFGDETLTWNEQYAFFGPTQATVDPFSHQTVRIKIESGEQVLWSGKLWAWGVVSHHHHH